MQSTLLAICTLGLVAVTSTACTSRSPSSPSVGISTLQGTAALSSYPAMPRSIQATDETGRITRADIAADGSFTVELRRAHTYRVDVVTDRGAVPLVFPRTSGKVTTTFALKSDGARLTLGQVRYTLRTTAVPVEARITKAFTIRTASLGGAGEEGNCENCGDDNQEVACEDGSHGNGQSSDDMEGTDDEAGSHGEASIAEHNVPENVDGCGDHQDDGENNDDNGESD